MSTPATSEMALADVARLEDIIDRDILAELCRSFFDLFGIPVRIVSRDGTLLASVHEEREICRYVNAFERGRVACGALVGEVRRIDPEEGPVEHPCFTGGMYRIVPIVYQGRRLGRTVVGPYVPAERKEVPRSLLVLDPRIDPHTARDALGEMPRVRKETIERITEHMGRMLDLLLFSGHRAFLTSEMHLASVRESYRELAEKTARLQEAYDRLRELDRLKSNFLATVSHELRTPLTSIIGYSEMLAVGLAGELNAEQREFVETIRSKGDHLLALITSLLDLNKLEQGSVTLQCEPVHPRELIEEVAKTVRPQASKKGVQLAVELAEPLEPIALDAVRMKQVLFNLADNAIKFTPPGGTVRFSARPMDVPVPEGGDRERDGVGLVLMMAPRRGVEFAVSDTGPGIPKSEHQRIFDAFYQVDGSSTRQHGGVGLGLAIVKRLVEAHGGTIEVESEPGRGTTFRVLIPERN
jgi:signal transduction histidine kinase